MFIHDIAIVCFIFDLLVIHFGHSLTCDMFISSKKARDLDIYHLEIVELSSTISILHDLDLPTFISSR